MSRRWLAAVAIAAVAASTLSAAPAFAAAKTPTAKVVLDPDNDFSHAIWDGVSYSELRMASRRVRRRIPTLAFSSPRPALSTPAQEPKPRRGRRTSSLQCTFRWRPHALRSGTQVSRRTQSPGCSTITPATTSLG